MLSGSAILRVSVLLAAAAVLAALVQLFWPSSPPGPVAPPTVAQAPKPVERAQPEPARTIPQPGPEAAPAPAPAPPPAPAPAPPPVAVPASPSLAAPPPAPEPDAAEQAQDGAGPRAVALVNLNTATVAELNGLKGGGAIGKAIVQRRPYASVDQLLAKRVLSRATYERIRDQVTAP